MRYTDLEGMTVVGSRGRRLGKVDDVSLDPKNWTVNGIEVALDNDVSDALGIETIRRKARLFVDPEDIEGVSDVVLLDYDVEGLRGRLGSRTGRRMMRY